jgi:perosamine synthetase
MDSGVLSKFLGTWSDEFYGGPRVRACEEAVKDRLGARHAVTVNSATTALQTAVAAAGVGPGDEVIVPPYTMSATASAVLLNNAIPVFADVEPDTYGLDPESVAERITEHTKAILAVHLFGHPARMGELLALAEDNGLAVIEDAAQSIGAEWDGRPTGTIGKLGVLSFNRHKIIQSGEGGVVLSDDDDAAEIARLIRNHGEVVVEDAGRLDLAHVVGSNYRMTEIEAAIATAQLAKLDGLLEHRRALAARLTERLIGLPGLTPARTEPNCSHSFYLYAVRIDATELGIDRPTLAAAIRAEGIPISEGYVKPIYLQPTYQRRFADGASGWPWSSGEYGGSVSYEPGICPTTERLWRHELMLLDVCRTPLTPADVDDVADAFEKVLEGREALQSRATA